MAQAALCDITPRTRIPTLLIVFCVCVLLHVDGCEFRPNRLVQTFYVPPLSLSFMNALLPLSPTLLVRGEGIAFTLSPHIMIPVVDKELSLLLGCCKSYCWDKL